VSSPRAVLEQLVGARFTETLQFVVDPSGVVTPLEPLGGIHTTNGPADPNTLARALVFMVCTHGRGSGGGG
jgi:hypothetical protein